MNPEPVDSTTGASRVLAVLMELAQHSNGASLSELADRLARIFARDASGRRAVFGGAQKFQDDPHWRDCLLFYEYFHGDDGAGLGASHQTGWTGVIARLLQLFATTGAEDVLARGKSAFHETLRATPEGRSATVVASKSEPVTGA